MSTRTKCFNFRLAEQAFASIHRRLLLFRLHRGAKVFGLNMCGACKLTCCVSPKGEIYPCAFLQDEDFYAGKLPDDDFKTIWDTSPVFDSFRQLEIKSCESCQRFDLCHGGCPAIAYHTQRKLGVPDPGCLQNCVKIKPVAKTTAGAH